VIRVLFVMSDLAAGGDESSLIELLGRLDRSRISPNLFLMQRAGIQLDRVPRDVPLSWGSELPHRSLRRTIAMVRSALREGRRADVIVGAMETLPTYMAWMVARLLRKPLACWIKTDIDQHLESLPTWHRWFARLIYPRCDAVAVASNGSAESLRRVAKLRPDAVHLIHDPVDPLEVRRMAEKPISRKLALLFEKPFVLGVGHLQNDQKGFDLLIEAHARTVSKGIDHNLIILGEGKDRVHLQQLARSLHVEHSTFLPGFQRNPFPYFKAASALAAPARLDDFGRTFLEAMALGLPIVGSPASGPDEVLQQGKYGIMVPADDPESLSCALVLLLQDGGIHAHYSRLSLERARDYDPAVIAVQWDELLCGLAAH
jgi:glycosyltransferase involved in cell wall biosynthesis